MTDFYMKCSTGLKWVSLICLLKIYSLTNAFPTFAERFFKFFFQDVFLDFCKHSDMEKVEKLLLLFMNSMVWATSEIPNVTHFFFNVTYIF